MTTLPQAHDVDLEAANCDAGGGIRHRHVPTTTGGEGGEEAAENNDVGGGDCKEKPEKRKSNASDSVPDPDEAGVNDVRVNVGDGDERDCRICMLGLDEDVETYGGPLELGCTCKDELGMAHKNCAETWFKMRGNVTCEICGSVAKNVHIVFEGRPGFEAGHMDHRTIIPPGHVGQSGHAAQTASYYPGRRLLNFILVLLIFIFILCWLFHFHMPTTSKNVY